MAYKQLVAAESAQYNKDTDKCAHYFSLLIVYYLVGGAIAALCESIKL